MLSLNAATEQPNMIQEQRYVSFLSAVSLSRYSIIFRNVSHFDVVVAVVIEFFHGFLDMMR